MTTFYGTDVTDIKIFGFDTAYGGNGNDTLFSDQVASFLYGGNGDDLISGAPFMSSGAGTLQDPGRDYKLAQIGGPVYAEGGAGNDLVFGSAGADTLYGGDGNESGLLQVFITPMQSLFFIGGLFGGAGNDYIDGGQGNDLIVGGLGKDRLIGGDGADTFQFSKDQLSNSFDSVKGAGRDVIKDFNHAEHDRIDLHLIDANETKAGDQAFKYIGANGFHHVKGELHEIQLANKTLVEGDTNGDGKADFQIELTGHLNLVKGDFVL